MKDSAEIGVFGGSGFYSLLEGMREAKIETPYGSPSDALALGEIGSRKVAFLPRHGKAHSLPPHMINYRANLWAMKSLGVTRIIGPTAAGSLKAYVKPGDFVVSDQLVDRTTGRKDTFYDGPVTTHVSFAHPYCPQVRALAIETIRGLKIPVHERGTVVTIQGPRFSTIAESRWFSAAGWEVINMTQYPEAYLARELEMCYANISLITDYDVGLEGQSGIEPVTHEGVIAVFKANNEHVKKVINTMVERMPNERTCTCGSALTGARIG
ncbi:MAG TPA: S-methyl-5'-thioadenosine phosphorylase [Candidatus Tumulicola sp.]|nr:S-methyl-5'-thioadenosine phosphorylase [Candidatus Tumulicola sp.]